MGGKPLIAPFLDGETGYGALNRLAAHYTGKNFEFSNTFSLARYMIDNSAEVSKFAGVLAMSGDSLWVSPDSHAYYAPYAFASGDRRRSFSFYELGAKFSSRQGILLFGPSA
ncbi:MAG: hypothetical protein G01um101413_560 [Parcubacteria group bacterium Gr01-1014_13]|nr:MAG: hypothetical protein G01um101413_560 [Parcubacteria group bacterium Gr01-1014_13]